MEREMPKLTKKRSNKAGLPPGALVHIGEKKTKEVKITIIDYDEMHVEEKEIKIVEECFSFRDRPTVTWINVVGLHQVEILGKLGDRYGLHPLVQEDILNTDQRPKMEDYGQYLYIVLKMLESNDKTNEIVTEQISLILGANFVISFQEEGGDVFNPIRERIRSGAGRIRKLGADYLAYTLLDAIIDNYFIILERLGEKIEFLEEKLVTQPTSETLQIIHHLKREMIFLRKAAAICIRPVSWVMTTFACLTSEADWFRLRLPHMESTNGPQATAIFSAIAASSGPPSRITGMTSFLHNELIL